MPSETARPAPSTILVGVISDTHGLLRTEAVKALGSCARILHAGDVGSPRILEELGRIAPVTVVRGNNDVGAWAAHLPGVVRVTIGAVRFVIIHDLRHLTDADVGPGVGVVVSGHSHQPRIESRGGVLYVNPGSAGPRRFRFPVTLARLTIESGTVKAELVEVVQQPR